jgi:ABC-type antimicrobial peptide transport system permease subunit
VQEHSRDMSIRLALGGTPLAVGWHVLRHGMAVVVAGVATGLVFAALGLRYLASLLFGVSASDPLAFATVGTALLGIAFVACAWPSRRAVRLDPATVLRSD